MFFGNRENKSKKIEDSVKECPVCHSTDTLYHVHSTNNGVMGPGYHSSITDEFYSCKKCGVRFNEVKK